jgi:hypothetical protein
LAYNTYIHGSAQEIPCIAILNKQKCHLFFFSFAKSEKGGRNRSFQWVEGVETTGRWEERWGKGVEVNMVQILWTHKHKWNKDGS